MYSEKLKEISMWDLFNALEEGPERQRAIYEAVKAECQEELKFKHTMTQWANLCGLFYDDDHTANKSQLRKVFKYFVQLVIAHQTRPVSFAFQNTTVQGRAMYFGVRLQVIKDSFLLWLQRPELFTYPNVSKGLSDALQQIIKTGEHVKYLYCYDSENVSDRYLNTVFVEAGFDFSSGVKCMLSSVQLEEDGVYSWRPKQYVGVKDCNVTKGGLEIFNKFILTSPNDAEQYGKGIAYFSQQIK